MVFFSETVVYAPSLRTAWFRKPIIHSERIFTNWILSEFKFEDYAHDFLIYSSETVRGFFGQNHPVLKPYGFLAPCLQTVKFFRSISKLG